jgi:hypothetical protein
MLRLLYAATFALAVVASPVAAGVHEDMVALDRTYVPALALTNQPKAEPAQKAIQKLRGEWDRFRGTYATAPAGYDATAWAKCSGEVEAAIAAAEANMRAGKGPAAHEDLEHVRDAQLALRRGAKQAYFFDDLTVFHEAMEQLAGPATGKTGATITDAEIGQIASALPQAERSWRIVVVNRAQAAKHGLAPEVEQQVQRDIDAETQLLAELKSALAAGDRARIAEKAQGTKPAFSRLFQRFGDFSGLR